MRGQNAMDTLNVRTARWVTKVPWHGGNSSKLSTGKQIYSQGLLVSLLGTPLRDHCFHRQIKITTGSVSQIKGRDLFNLNFRYRIKYLDSTTYCPFSRRFGNSGNFRFHWPYHFASCSAQVTYGI